VIARELVGTFGGVGLVGLDEGDRALVGRGVASFSKPAGAIRAIRPALKATSP
jgi:hypothetical protein